MAMIETQDLTRQLAQRELEGELVNGGRRKLGTYLRGLRLATKPKISLEAMANKVGCCKSYLWDVEDDRVMPTLLMADKIAKSYKTTVSKMAKMLEYGEIDNDTGKLLEVPK